MPKSKTPKKQRRMVAPAYLVSRALRFMRAEAFKTTEIVADPETADG